MQVISQDGAAPRGPSEGPSRCTVCPRGCLIGEGARGYCQVRVREGDAVVLAANGLASGFQVEPIEAFDLVHFLPGTMALAVGRGGTNLGPPPADAGEAGRPEVRDAGLVPPRRIARWAEELACPTVALGGTDPSVAPIYAREVAQACRAAGLKVALLSRGYMSMGARAQLLRQIDAARIELLGFSERTYRRAGGHLRPVLATITELAAAGAWLEISLRLRPGHNDSRRELLRFADWVITQLGPDVPVHLNTAHLIGVGPLRERNAARAGAIGAERILRGRGIRHVYTDDLFDHSARTTVCAGCGTTLIEREWYMVTRWNLAHGDHCPSCGATCAGIFPPVPNGVLVQRGQAGPLRKSG